MVFNVPQRTQCSIANVLFWLMGPDPFEMRSAVRVWYEIPDRIFIAIYFFLKANYISAVSAYCFLSANFSHFLTWRNQNASFNTSDLNLIGEFAVLQTLLLGHLQTAKHDGHL